MGRIGQQEGQSIRQGIGLGWHYMEVPMVLWSLICVYHLLTCDVTECDVCLCSVLGSQSCMVYGHSMCKHIIIYHCDQP